MLGLKIWPALDLDDLGDSDLLLVALDDFRATAIEERGGAADPIRVFFADARSRDEALAGLPSRFLARPVDVADEDWARRSQQDLAPVTVGGITIFPSLESFNAGPVPLPGALVIQPSMGFGTGHHATTRLCLAALQTLDLADRSLVDLGTGSGVLALAARLLGAREALGIDYDADAIQSAEENLALNRPLGRVRFEVRDLLAEALPRADVVTANLTGAMLTRAAGALLRMLHGAGTLVVSGVQADERAEVFAALAPARLGWEQ
ncbi:MAG: methyltransferase domain-containing protein, partial [Luteitalea sp.]|nr:methyltransferase domain-containing protein [Luteitalea sp.]